MGEILERCFLYELLFNDESGLAAKKMAVLRKKRGGDKKKIRHAEQKKKRRSEDFEGRRSCRAAALRERKRAVPA